MEQERDLGGAGLEISSAIVLETLRDIRVVVLKYRTTNFLEHFGNLRHVL